MLRRLAALLLLVPLATGCTKNGRMAAGGIVAITGVAIAAAPNDTYTREGWFGGTHEHEDHSNDVIGGLLLITGVVLLLAGAAARDEDEEPPMVTIYPQPVAYMPAIAVPAAPSVVVDAPSAQTVIVANTVVVDHSPARAALASNVANRLAIQASVTARAGQCEAAVLTAKKLAEIDFELYERLLVTDEAVARCSTL